MNNLLKFTSVLFVFFLISCATGNKGSQLVVGTNAEFPPFEYIENNIITGFDIDLITAIAKEMGKTVKIENLSWEGLLPALQSRKVDLIIAGMTVTEDRKAVVNFSDSYYTSKEQMIIVQNDNTDITNMDSLIGKKVGVMLGFTGDMIISSMEGVIVERYNTAFQAVTSLQDDKIDAIVLDYEPARNYAKENKNIKLITGNNTQEEYSIAIKKEDTELLVDINEALNIIRSNGTYETIYQKYFPNN